MAAKIIIASAVGNTRILIRKMLENNNYNIPREVSALQELLQWALVHKPEVILFDINLLENQKQCAAALRSLKEALPDTHIICLGAHPEKTLIVAAIQNGAKTFLPTPIDEKKLLNSIQSLL